MYLERCLEIGIDHALQEQRYGVRIDDTCKEVERLIQNALDNETDSEERYWALMSRAELKIVTQEQKETGDTIEKITKDIQAAVELAGPRSFLLDSTLQQFRMMLELGFQTELLLAAVEKLETALNHYMVR